jgi:hypothetical protein
MHVVLKHNIQCTPRGSCLQQANKSAINYSLCVQTKHSIIAYKVIPRTQWVQEWPGQVVLAGSSVYWTEGVERGINTNTMQDFFDNVQVNAIFHSTYSSKVSAPCSSVKDLK